MRQSSHLGRKQTIWGHHWAKKRGIFGEERGILNIQRLLQQGVGSVFTHLPLQQHKKAEGSADTNFPKEFPKLPPSEEPIKYPSEINFSLAKLLSQAPVPQQNHRAPCVKREGFPPRVTQIPSSPPRPTHPGAIPSPAGIQEFRGRGSFLGDLREQE